MDVSAYASGIGDGSVVFALSGELRTYCGIDTAMLALSFVDAGGAVLSTTKSCRYQDSVWASSVMVLTPPTSTRAVWVHLIAEARGGNDADGYFNNLSLLACTPGGKRVQPQAPCWRRSACLECRACTVLVCD